MWWSSIAKVLFFYVLLLKASAHQTQDSSSFVWMRTRTSCNTRNSLPAVIIWYNGIQRISCITTCNRIQTAQVLSCLWCAEVLSGNANIFGGLWRNERCQNKTNESHLATLTPSKQGKLFDRISLLPILGSYSSNKYLPLRN
jgi:hypothetical protein